MGGSCNWHGADRARRAVFTGGYEKIANFLCRLPFTLIQNRN
jgi:hypothetical protein